MIQILLSTFLIVHSPIHSFKHPLIGKIFVSSFPGTVLNAGDAMVSLGASSAGGEGDVRTVTHVNRCAQTGFLSYEEEAQGVLGICKGRESEKSSPRKYHVSCSM